MMDAIATVGRVVIGGQTWTESKGDRHMADRMLIQGGYVVPIDDAWGDISPGDALSEGVRTAAEGPELAAGDDGS